MRCVLGNWYLPIFFGVRSQNSCPNWWALIGAQRKLVPTGCAACSRRTAVTTGRGAFRPDSRGLDAGVSAISLSTSHTHQSPTHRASQMVFKTDKSKKATAGHQRRREREHRELAAVAAGPAEEGACSEVADDEDTRAAATQRGTSEEAARAR